MSVVVGQHNAETATNTISKSGLIIPPASMARQLSGTTSSGGKHMGAAEPTQSSSALPLPSRRQKPFMKHAGRSKKKKISILS